MSEPWPRRYAHGATDRAGHAHRPLEAGQPGGDGAAGHHGQAGRPSGPDRGAVDRDAVEPLPQADGDAGEAGVGDQQVRALPDHQHRHGPTGCGRRGGDPAEVVLRADGDEQCGRTADAVGGHGPQRHVALGQRHERVARRRIAAGVRREARAAGPRVSAVGQGRDVAGARVMQRSPARRRDEERNHVGGCCTTRRLAGAPSGMAFCPPGAVMPGRGASRNGYTSGTTTSRPDETRVEVCQRPSVRCSGGAETTTHAPSHRSGSETAAATCRGWRIVATLTPATRPDW